MLSSTKDYVHQKYTNYENIYNEYVHKLTDWSDISKLFNIYLLNKKITSKNFFNISLPIKEKTTASFFYL